MADIHRWQGMVARVEGIMTAFVEVQRVWR